MKASTWKNTSAYPHTGFAMTVVAAQVAVALALPAQPAHADEGIFPPLVLRRDNNVLTIKGTVTYGTIVRAEGRNPELVPPGNAARVGAQGRAPGGVNVDDGDLNYARGDKVSTTLKGLFDIEWKHGESFRAFLRAKAWDDYAQRKEAVPHGNLPNNYLAQSALSDSGFGRYGRFNGGVLMDAYLEGTLQAAGRPLMARLGSQRIEWGNQDTTILGGLEQINAIDYVARYRAGALKEEGYIPVPALFARWGTRETTALEAFYLFRFQENELPGCGTFFALTDYSPPGCDKVLAQPPTVSDPAAIAAGIFARRAPDGTPSDSGQFGLALIHTVPDLGRFGAYFANYHSRRFVPSAFRSSRTALGGTPLVPGDPGGQNVRYFIEYPADVRVFGLTFGTVLPGGMLKGTGISAEYTYRPNQNVSLGSTDLFNAFASNTAATQLRGDATATPLGGIFHGYDRRKISQFTLGMRNPYPERANEPFSVSAEAGFKYIHDLPDVNVRRYGRSDVYGLGPVNGVCPAGASDKQCSNRGFVTAFSWGYRFRLSTRHSNVINGVDILPFVGFAHDVKGWSHDAIFNEGRKGANLGVRAEVRRNFFVEAAWSPVGGGDYNFVKDRDTYTVFGGMTF